MELQDCIIVGGGPAGLNAAVVLGRCRRNVLLFDTSTYRNQYSHGVHNYLTRDDILPNELLALAHKEIKKYGVKMIRKKIVSTRKNGDGLFVARDEDGKEYHSKKMLIATGLRDNVPSIPGFKELYGKSVFHCPYCDGWEVQNKELGVYARNKNGYELAIALKCWSAHVTLYTDGRNKLKPTEVETLTANNISIVSYPISHLEAKGDQLHHIQFRNGDKRRCDALFFVNGFEQQCNLAETFGCDMTKKGVVVTNRFQQTNISGLYVAGDASKDMHFVVVAAAEGAKAGVIINKELIKEEMVQPAEKLLV
ncbi:NAD(P)/FAD-dependent oxidoreductase [Flavisolibacter sp. BT320]|nr:NAD(P)/FAD-dependent oxidoreductase [Flavisolibacter longurius]